MKKRFFPIFALAVAALGSCGHGKTYRVEGVLGDSSSINLRMLTYGDGTVTSGITASQDGRFRFEAPVQSPVMVEVYDNDYRLLVRFAAKPGDDIKLKIDRFNPLLSIASGNKITEQWYKFLNTNASVLDGADRTAANAAVAAFIGQNPDAPASALLLMTQYDTTTPRGYFEADSLLQLLGPEARKWGFENIFSDTYSRYGKSAFKVRAAAIPYRTASGDTALFRTSQSRLSIIAVSDMHTRGDSVTPTLRAASARGASVVDLSADADTTSWKRWAEADTVSWHRGWLPGGISGRGIDRLELPAVPYFVVTDSLGRQLWRGESATLAKKFIEKSKL